MDIRKEQRSINFRSPTRPRAEFLRPRHKATREDRLASGRARSSGYRRKLDDLREPETYTAAILSSVLTSERYDETMNVTVGRAFDLLEAAGFDVAKTKDRMKRLRIRLLREKYENNSLPE